MFDTSIFDKYINKLGIEDLINSPEALNNISDALERFKVDNASDLILAQVNELLNTYFGDFN